MIVVVTGTRKLTRHPNRLVIKQRFFDMIDAWNPEALYHGGAEGPDSWAALEYPTIAKMFRPEQTEGRSPSQRLFDRNETMIRAAKKDAMHVVLVACWDGRSSGTWHAMSIARELHIHIDKVRIEE